MAEVGLHRYWGCRHFFASEDNHPQAFAAHLASRSSRFRCISSDRYHSALCRARLATLQLLKFECRCSCAVSLFVCSSPSSHPENYCHGVFWTTTVLAHVCGKDRTVLVCAADLSVVPIEQASSVPLRLLALARRAKAEPVRGSVSAKVIIETGCLTAMAQVIKVLRACTLWIFGLSRILNGAFCMRRAEVFVKLRGSSALYCTCLTRLARSLLVASRRHVSDKM